MTEGRGTTCPHDDVTSDPDGGWYCTSCHVRFEPVSPPARETTPDK